MKPGTTFLIALLLATTSASGGAGKVSSPVFPVIARALPAQVSIPEYDATRRLLHLTPQGRVLPTPAGLSAQDTVFRTVSIVNEDWDTVGSAWLGLTMETMTYDAEGKEIERVGRTWVFIDWMNQFSVLHSYDHNDRPVLIRSRIWTGFYWQDNAKDSIIYDASGKPVEERVDVFTGGGWVPYQRFQVSYDGSQRLSEVVGQNWSGSAWVNAFRYTIARDGAGMMTEFLRQVASGGGWANSARETYAYSGSGRPVQETHEYWGGGVWNNEDRYNWSYDSNDFLVEMIAETWGGSAWVNDVRETFNNDAEGLPGDILQQYWDGFVWVDDMITYISYDLGNVVEEYTQAWEGGTWVNHHRTAYAWTPIIRPSQVTEYYDVSDKWNMVSVPLDVSDHARTSVFPTSVSNAFAFNAGYTAAADLLNGAGYWLKFDGGQSVPVTGVVVETDTFDVTAGWNMVGTISVPVNASAVGSIPPGLVSSAFFGFENGYVAAPSLEPGKGYWVKLAGAGKIILTGAGALPQASLLRMELSDREPPPPPFVGAAMDPAPAAVPGELQLEQNYPNPFNPATTIRFTLPSAGRARLTVYNAIGQAVRVLVDEVLSAGPQNVEFDAAGLPSGVYTAAVSAAGKTEIRRMLLLR